MEMRILRHVLKRKKKKLKSNDLRFNFNKLEKTQYIKPKKGEVKK